jgi:hypothetical protein
MLNMSDNPTMINKMKVSELQAELTKRHLDTTGIKQVLVNRLLPSMEIVEPETANDDEQQNKAEGNMELAHDEGQDDSKDDRQDDSKDENKSSLNELYSNYKHPYSFENAIQDIRQPGCDNSRPYAPEVRQIYGLVLFCFQQRTTLAICVLTFCWYHMTFSSPRYSIP